MTSWRYNTHCPLCDQAVESGPEWSETLHLPSYNFLMIHPKVFRDVLPPDDPLRKYFFQFVHWNCFAAWPERKRFSIAYADWVAEYADSSWYSGVAFRNEEFLVTAPSRLTGHDRVSVLMIPLMCSIGFPIVGRGGIDDLQEKVKGAHPLYREGVRSALEFMRTRFSTPESAIQAVPWTAKKTPCAICSKPLGANPASEPIFRLPGGYGEGYGFSSGLLKEFTRALTHTECFLGWPERQAFGKMLMEGERRISALSETLGCACADDSFVLLVQKDIEWRDPILRLSETGTQLRINCREWGAWLENPDAHHPDLRPFERNALRPVIEVLRSRFPTMGSLSSAVDWNAKIESFERAVEAIKAECARLGTLRRELICPSCGQVAESVKSYPKYDYVRFPCCDREASPPDFGWLP